MFISSKSQNAKKALFSSCFSKASRKNEKNAKQVLFASSFRVRFCSSLGYWSSTLGVQCGDLAARIRNLREKPSPGLEMLGNHSIL